MIKALDVRNFKSIKDLKLDCRRVNVFIGEPNTGKSNILEVIGFLSHIYFGDLRKFVRLESMADIFYDHELSEEVLIRVIMSGGELPVVTRFINGEFHVGKKGETPLLKYDYSARIVGKAPESPRKTFALFKFYRFETRSSFPSKELKTVVPPDGPNLPTILMTNKELRKLVRNILGNYGLKLILKPTEDRIEVAKEYEDILITYPYKVLSGTMQRLILYLAAIETNEESVIALEEPEAHSFPYYTKYLAERIALDERNQYFISTHNPYFLLSLIEKTPISELAVYVTYYKNYQTKVKELGRGELENIVGKELDAFFNMEELLGG